MGLNMIINKMQNLHTHTIYCDGVDTPQEMIEEAINKGFSGIGFSGHSYMYYAPEHSMSQEGTEEYKKDVFALKDVYKDKIDVFCGLEVDMYSEIDLSGYDYLIGSVHYLKLGNEIIGIDRSEEVVSSVINKYFDNDGMKYAKEYYKTLAMLPDYGNFDFVGHFDLITKHKDNRMFFDESSKEYHDIVVETAEHLVKKIPFYEVNTGAMARGYRKHPYPSLALLKEFKRLGFRTVISSDCHNKKMLDHGFETAIELLKEAGFEEHYILTKNGFVPVSL